MGLCWLAERLLADLQTLKHGINRALVVATLHMPYEIITSDVSGHVLIFRKKTKVHLRIKAPII